VLTGTTEPDRVTIEVPAVTRSWSAAVAERTRSEVDAICGEHDPVRSLVLRVLDDGAAQLHASRLVGMAVAGALTGEPESGLPVCVVSRLWWTGAQLLDDLADGAPLRLPSGAVILAGTICVAGLPMAVIDRQPLAAEVASHWRAELLSTSLHAASGQLTDLSTMEDLTWARVVAGYRGKSGAPYGRDAVMAARLGTDDPAALRGWRAFGELFGVLRQLANDAAPDSVDEDLRNGTRTALLVHALSVAEAGERERLLKLREAAPTDPQARALLRESMVSPSIMDSYRAQVEAMRRQGCLLLDQLAPPSPHRELLHALVHGSAHQAISY